MAGVNKQTFVTGMAIVGGAALLLGALFGGIVGYQVGSGSSATTAATAGKKVYTRDEFRAAVMGKTQSEVIALLGKPDRTSEDTGSGPEWLYYDIRRDPLTGKLDQFTTVRFLHGRVVEIH